MTCLGEDMGIIVTFWGNVVSAFGVMLSSGSTFVVVRGCFGSCFGVLVTDGCSLLVMILVFGFDGSGGKSHVVAFIEGCWLQYGEQCNSFCKIHTAKTRIVWKKQFCVS